LTCADNEVKKTEDDAKAKVKVVRAKAKVKKSEDDAKSCEKAAINKHSLKALVRETDWQDDAEGLYKFK
jgi:hypothetical protein